MAIHLPPNSLYRDFICHSTRASSCRPGRSIHEIAMGLLEHCGVAARTSCAASQSSGHWHVPLPVCPGIERRCMLQFEGGKPGRCLDAGPRTWSCKDTMSKCAADRLHAVYLLQTRRCHYTMVPPYRRADSTDRTLASGVRAWNTGGFPRTWRTGHRLLHDTQYIPPGMSVSHCFPGPDNRESEQEASPPAIKELIDDIADGKIKVEGWKVLLKATGEEVGNVAEVFDSAARGVKGNTKGMLSNPTLRVQASLYRTPHYDQATDVISLASQQKEQTKPIDDGSGEAIGKEEAEGDEWEQETADDDSVFDWETNSDDDAGSEGATARQNVFCVEADSECASRGDWDRVCSHRNSPVSSSSFQNSPAVSPPTNQVNWRDSTKDTAASLPRMVDARNVDSADDQVQFLIPLVPAIVQGVDTSARQLVIEPPEGLLDLGEIPRRLSALRPLLLQFCAEQSEGVEKCRKKRRMKAKGFVVWRHGAVRTSVPTDNQAREGYMPTRQQLLAAGRQDLVQKIAMAGGFPAVAQALNLRSRRRPIGFWEDLQNLDAEIEWFIAQSWKKQKMNVSSSVKVWYYNTITKAVSWEKPPRPDVRSPLPVSSHPDDAGTAVMPTAKDVLSAGRYDLHIAINLHGGYREAGAQLGRQKLPSPLSMAQVMSEIRQFMDSEGLSEFPTSRMLKESGRLDLWLAVRRFGGTRTFATAMRVRAARNGRHFWEDLDSAAVAIWQYITCKEEVVHTSSEGTNKQSTQNASPEMSGKEDERLLSTPYTAFASELRMPTLVELQDAGRWDLRYAIMKFSAARIAARLGLEANRAGRKTQIRKSSNVHGGHRAGYG
ncbi:hypothetical protein CBR_g33977 [Chara braunii]|uniref:WW domain-containing protein n=1 Tax=Chara braunii TaxID=69332 RepID=A0A388LHP2_CHABU|nr:hypothetical protein CBR_g33977 [Chara braunii]|eukprot:GBG81797.1 hypothetical protein CBR_g33977 [Chara braunii]